MQQRWTIQCFRSQDPEEKQGGLGQNAGKRFFSLKLIRDNDPLVLPTGIISPSSVDWAGVAFLVVAKKLLENGQPVSYPTSCDGVFCGHRHRIETGTDHDATARHVLCTRRAQQACNLS